MHLLRILFLKYSLVSIFFLFIGLTVQAHAQTPAQKLKTLLNGMHSLQGKFKQQVFDEDRLILSSTGEFAIQRPSQFYWYVAEPDELFITADGQTIEYYDPFIEQLTLYSQESMLSTNPFVLLLEQENWQGFQIQEYPDFWSIKSAEQTEHEELRLFFNEDNRLTQIEVISPFNEKSVFELTDLIYNELLQTAQFKLPIPKGVEIDDQR